jgi:tetratricopeptide (TPR) repeat protein
VPNLADQNLLGLTYLQLGYTDEAIRFFDDGLDLSPLNQSFLTNKATALRKSGRLQEALQCYKRALEVGLASASAWGNLAQLFVEMDSPSAALGAVEKGLALAPDNLPLIGNKALVLFKLGRSAEALALNEAVLATHPKNGRLLPSMTQPRARTWKKSERCLAAIPILYSAKPHLG